jgi:hypothetical protein
VYEWTHNACMYAHTHTCMCLELPTAVLFCNLGVSHGGVQRIPWGMVADVLSQYFNHFARAHLISVWGCSLLFCCNLWVSGVQWISGAWLPMFCMTKRIPWAMVANILSKYFNQFARAHLISVWNCPQLFCCNLWVS